jgi:hyperosmotically inducible protein
MALGLSRAVGFVGSLALATGLLASTPLQAEQAKAPDAAMRDQIERRIQADPSLGKYDVRVRVDQGDVKLEGTVASADQKKAAETLAKIAGVDEVDNDIEVDRDADQVLANRASKGLRRTGEAVNDAWITSKVRWFFVGDTALDGSDIDVEVKDRVVTLDGEVRSEEGRARALELANRVDGVVKVVDKLKVDRD